MDGAAQSVFALGGIFSNNVLLGLPLAKIALGEGALPAVSLVLVFNSLLLWTLATVSVEWARHRRVLVEGPVEDGGGRCAESDRRQHPRSAPRSDSRDSRCRTFIDQTMELLGNAAIPLSLVALGMGLAGFGARRGLARKRRDVVHEARRASARRLRCARGCLRLPPLETAAIVMLAALPVGANVYLMSRQFDVLTGPVASAIVRHDGARGGDDADRPDVRGRTGLTRSAIAKQSARLHWAGAALHDVAAVEPAASKDSRHD